MTDTNQSIWREETIHTEEVYKGKVVSLQLETVKLRDGTLKKREIVKQPSAAAVIAIIDGKLLLVEQYRKAIDKIQLEIPAGKLDPEELPEQAALRELEEETGYRAQSITLLEKLYTAPGFSDKILYIYYADDIVQGKMNLDEDEEVIVHLVTLEEAEKHVATGFIGDAKTILAVYAWKLFIKTGALK